MNHKIATLILAASACLSAFPQAKIVNEAEKLIGIDGKAAQARQLISQAMQDSTTKDDAHTWVVAANIEIEYFETEYHKLTINPADSRVDKTAMSQAIIDAYRYYSTALPLDTIITPKGKIKTKYSKEIQKRLKQIYLNRHFLWAASVFTQCDKRYPEAYNAFSTQGDIPGLHLYHNDKNLSSIADSIRGNAYYNAAVSAWSGQQHLIAAQTFHKARRHGYITKDLFAYEIACYQAVIQSDTLNIESAENAMFLTAKDGYDTYGCQEPLFLHLYIKGLTERQQFSQAITILDKEIALDPDNDSLYRHRAFVYDYAGDDDASVADYIKAGTLSSDFQTLIEAGKKIAMVGGMKINDINKTDNSDSAKAKKQQIVEMYFNQALAFANKAKAINPDNTNVDLLIENITYDITSNSY